jgi:DNA repair protein RadC
VRHFPRARCPRLGGVRTLAPVAAALDYRPWTGLDRKPGVYREVIERARAIGPIANAHRAAWVMMPRAEREDQEVAWSMGLDTHGFLRGVAPVARGRRDGVSVTLVDAIRPLVVDGARYMIFFHNHPSGSARPSQADADLTAYMAKESAGLVLLLDHVILGLGEAYSFRERTLWEVR